MDFIERTSIGLLLGILTFSLTIICCEFDKQTPEEVPYESAIDCFAGMPVCTESGFCRCQPRVIPLYDAATSD